MKKINLITIFLATLFILLSASLIYAEQGRICGVIHTRDGDTFEGPIRWDKNEAFWDDILDATKEREGRHSEGRRRERHIEIFGIRINWDEDREESRASSGIKFGHIRSLERRSRNRAILHLKSGERIMLYGDGSDLGSGIREILIDDPAEGEVFLDWDDLDEIEFKECEKAGKQERRLYGQVETRNGETFKGFITWDMDELFCSDILDGEEKGRTRKIPFGKIKAIERRSRNSAWVYLKNGDQMKLSGTNDVNSGNRGIVVKDPYFGRVTIEWEDFDRCDFLEGEEKYLKNYDEFDGGHPLYGIVYDEDGESYEGYIRWDDDETESWELLDGEYRGLEVDVEFSQIESIERKSSNGAKVTLKNGNSFKLEDSNDVNDENKGIFITTKDGKEIELDWYDFEKVIFKER
ncbi:MAG: hypothetical protein KAW16_08295 [candidate division Zixibacteria bacterium]|nr:hypothetical protein [candidate division Zixibacteria bacterium]